MSIAFPTNLVGTYSKAETKWNEHYGNWGNGQNPFSRIHPVTCPLWRSIKENTPAFTPGDRLYANPYYRHAAVVKEDIPTHFYRSGSDWNGAYYENWVEPISQFIPSHIIDSYTPFASVTDNLVSRVTTEALLKLKEGKVQSGADLGEAGQTANMIADQALQLFKAYKALRDGNLSGFLSTLGLTRRGIATGKTLADHWLAYQYGWKPLMGALHDSIELLQSQLRQKDSLHRVVRRGKEHRTYQVLGSHHDDTLLCDAKVEVGLTTRVSNSIVDRIDTFGLLNPLEVAWELIPFSFVADWFIPIGNVLESLSARAGLDFVTGYRTTTVSYYSRTIRNSSNMNPGWYLLDPGLLVRETFTVKREAFYEFPNPEFYADTTPFSPTRAANAVALLRQLLLT